MELETRIAHEIPDPHAVEDTPCADGQSQEMAEDGRLAEILEGHLALSAFQPLGRAAVLRSVCSGLSKIPESEAESWRIRLERIASAEWPSPVESRTPHPILQVLRDQPFVGFSACEQEQCRIVGARAFIAIGFQLRDLPKGFAHGLTQLFRNAKPAWAQLRQQLVAGNLELAIDLGNDAAHSFRVQLRRLFATQLAAPSRAAAPPPTLLLLTGTEDESSKGEAVIEKIEEQDDVSAAWDLFERQVQRCMQPELVDGNRLPIHWMRLTTKETLQVFKRINKDFHRYAKDDAGFRRAVYAAMRVLSFQSAIAMRECFRMPLGSGGDMWLDLRKGVIVRDWSRAVPRRIRPAHMDRLIEVTTPLAAEALRVFAALIEREPLATTVGELVKAEGITLRMMGQSLNADWPTSHRPEDARFAISWAPVLLELGVHPAIAARITGEIMLTPITDQVYTALQDDAVDAAIGQSLQWLGLTPTEMPYPREIRGSAKYRPVSELRALVVHLGRMIEEARSLIKPRSPLDAVIAFHNLFTIAIALIFEWMHATRGSKPERRTFEALVASDRYLLISDKKTDLYGQVRVMPKTDLCRELLNVYCEHLVSVSGWLSKRKHPAAKQFDRIASGRLPSSPMFLLLETSGLNNRGFRNVRRKDLANLFLQVAAACQLEVTQDDLNCFRHFAYSSFANLNVWQTAIDSLLGHHTVGAEPHGFFSGVSIREVADYARGALDALQRELGLTSLRGLGRTDDRYMRAPALALDRHIEPLPNQYLLRKLKEDEELVDDHFARQQDPPATLQTLRWHAAVEALKDGYVKSAEVRQYPAGALILCLVLFDGVLARAELEAFYTALTEGLPHSVGAHAIIEVESEGLPILQRSLSNDTVATWWLLHLRGKAAQWMQAIEQLHNLLRALNTTWPGTTAGESLGILAAMCGHWMAVEIAPASAFVVHHKAPFIPLDQLARIHYQRPCIPKSITRPEAEPRRLLPYAMFSVPMDIVRTWADPDEKLGSADTRREKCITKLNELLNDATRDYFEREFIGQLLADLSKDAPYKRLAVSTLAQRITKYVHVYGIFQRENSFELDLECFLELLDEFGGRTVIEQSEPARWVLLHVSAYLSSRGHKHCLGSIHKGAVKFARPVRNPVYVSAHEIKLACDRIPDRLLIGADGSELACARLLIERNVPSRHADIKYMRLRDFDEDAGLLHFASSGHAHLKGNKHGTCHVPDTLLPEAASLKRHKLELSANKEALLFGDSHDREPYSRFDSLTRAIRDELVAVTGCPQFRRHDLRASALTDMCLGSKVEEMLSASWRVEPPRVLERGALQAKYQRVYAAQRAARHSSGCVSLRHYNVGSILDLRREFDIADAMRVRGPWYLQALKQGAPSPDATIGDAPRTPGLNSLLPVPRTGSRVARGTDPAELTPAAPIASLIHAVILHSLGASTEAIAVATQLSIPVVEQSVGKVTDILKGLRVRWRPRSAVRVFSLDPKRDQPDLYEIGKRFSRWIADAKRAKVVKVAGPMLLAAIGTDAHLLRFSNQDTLLDFVRVMQGIETTGVKGLIGCSPADMPGGPVAGGSGFTWVEPFNTSAHAEVRFLLSEARTDALTSLRRVSPRALGTVGALVIAGLVATVTL